MEAANAAHLAKLAENDAMVRPAGCKRCLCSCSAAQQGLAWTCACRPAG